jgi:hypothetical protein
MARQNNTTRFGAPRSTQTHPTNPSIHLQKTLRMTTGDDSEDESNHDTIITSEESTLQEYQRLELRHKRWSHAVHDYVATDLFRYVQFINRDEDVMFGSSIQKVVCKACGVPPGDQLQFWTNVGNEKVKEVMKRKRQTVTTAFRMKFESKLIP